jgi:hypothetical protein
VIESIIHKAKKEETEMTTEALEARIQALEKKVQTLEDIEDIKKLQRAYGYYLERYMSEDLIDLFADGPDTCLTIAAGQFKGKDSVVRFFRHGRTEPIAQISSPELLHQVMQLCGVVNVAPDGKTAQGRWYGFGAHRLMAQEGGSMPGWMNGVYEVDYVKEKGIWKLKKVHWCMYFHSPWSDPTKHVVPRMDRPYDRSAPLKPTGAPEETRWPSGFICPFHFKNPVSGRQTDVAKFSPVSQIDKG